MVHHGAPGQDASELEGRVLQMPISAKQFHGFTYHSQHRPHACKPTPFPMHLFSPCPFPFPGVTSNEIAYIFRQRFPYITAMVHSTHQNPLTSWPALKESSVQDFGCWLGGPFSREYDPRYLASCTAKFGPLHT